MKLIILCLFVIQLTNAITCSNKEHFIQYTHGSNCNSCSTEKISCNSCKKSGGLLGSLFQQTYNLYWNKSYSVTVCDSSERTNFDGLSCIGTNTCHSKASSSTSYFGSCIPNCLSCNDEENVCSKCAEGYFRNNAKWCSECSKKSNCAKCSQTENKCLECNTNYYPKDDKCQKCDIRNCQTCSTTAALCATCNSNYYPTTSGTCATCTSKNCATCDQSTGYCSTCNDKYYPSNGECLACSNKANCETCSKTEDK